MITEKDFQLCESITEEEAVKLDNERYKANFKFDGERIIAVIINHDSILINRRGKICNFHFQEIAEDLKVLDDSIIDGEIISIDDNFNKLLKRALTKDISKLKQLQTEIPVKFMVFDILRVGNNLITTNPLKERIEELKKLFKEKQLKHTELIEYGNIKEIFEKAKKEDKEGIVVKDLTGTYEHRRSKNWLKCKFMKEIDLKMNKYTINPMGIRIENDKEIAVQVAGEISKEVKEIIDTKGEVTITMKYLSETDKGKYRFCSFKKIVYV